MNAETRFNASLPLSFFNALARDLNCPLSMWAGVPFRFSGKLFVQRETAISKMPSIWSAYNSTSYETPGHLER